MPTASDLETLLRAQAGDRTAQERLWERHRRWLAAVLILHGSRESEVDDLLQEVAAVFVAKVSSLRDPATFSGWLRSIALNAARMSARGARRRRAAVERFTHEVASIERREAAAPNTEAAHRLRERLAALPAGYAEPLLLRLVHDLSYTRIAEILELPETTIENRIVRGRRMLREQAAADFGHIPNS